MSVTILRVGRDASGWAMRDPSDCLTAGITSKLILISSGIGAASATFRKQVPGPPVSVYSGYLYVETDDPYGTYLSESDFGYFTPTFGKLSYGSSQPTRIYRQRASLTFQIPNLTGKTILSAIMSIPVTAYNTSLESFTPTMYYQGDQHLYNPGWWNTYSGQAGTLAFSISTQTFNLDAATVTAASNSYLSLLFVSDKELSGSGAGASGTAQSSMAINLNSATLALTVY